MSKKIYYIDRRDGQEKEEKIYCEETLRFLYGSKVGRFFNFLLSRLTFFSHLTGFWYRSGFSKKSIAPFIEKFAIETAEFAEPIEAYRSFDAFFTRTLKKEARPLAPGLIIPADGRYLAYQNVAESDGFIVKGVKFTLAKLLNNPQLAEHYVEGSMLIGRLCPSDYHRFHFPIDGLPNRPQLINGPLYSVNPLAIKQNIHLLSENKRMVTHLTTQDSGTILYIEIGATAVGSIHQTFTPNQPVKKGDEKGYFSFGGSSIILLFEKGRLHFASDLVINSHTHIETLCLFGQPLERPLNHHSVLVTNGV